ncbi:unnamed protein product [Protopolystoma xenopodis]|uniref:Diacylglycerol kinase iota-like domain-containing protein n=1 Tax=Protopolystoma xenopodis TaxID=117903 RepID=A0A3S5A428_9PLAT|nr:unnamed protein product [Protopolystoma xenopodis]
MHPKSPRKSTTSGKRFFRVDRNRESVHFITDICSSNELFLIDPELAPLAPSHLPVITANPILASRASFSTAASPTSLLNVKPGKEDDVDESVKELLPPRHSFSSNQLTTSAAEFAETNCIVDASTGPRVGGIQLGLVIVVVFVILLVGIVVVVVGGGVVVVVFVAILGLDIASKMFLGQTSEEFPVLHSKADGLFFDAHKRIQQRLELVHRWAF